jgi:hypothetical protein
LNFRPSGRRRAAGWGVPYWQRPAWVERTIAAAEATRRRREAARVAALEALGPQTVVLVSCGAQKGKERARARDLYTSTLFRKARAFAERHGDAYFIISALHGLVSPDQELSPYNFKLSQLRHAERFDWGDRVARAIRRQVPAGSRIIILAGRLYRDALEWRLVRYGFDVECPTRGQNIFQLMSYLTKTAGEARRLKRAA